MVHMSTVGNFSKALELLRARMYVIVAEKHRYNELTYHEPLSYVFIYSESSKDFMNHFYCMIREVSYADTRIDRNNECLSESVTYFEDSLCLV